MPNSTIFHSCGAKPAVGFTEDGKPTCLFCEECEEVIEIQRHSAAYNKNHRNNMLVKYPFIDEWQHEDLTTEEQRIILDWPAKQNED